jgi:hypothetical protein
MGWALAPGSFEDELYKLQLRWASATDETEKKKAADEILRLLEKVRANASKA